MQELCRDVARPRAHVVELHVEGQPADVEPHRVGVVTQRQASNSGGSLQHPAPPAHGSAPTQLESSIGAFDARRRAVQEAEVGAYCAPADAERELEALSPCERRTQTQTHGAA